MYRPADDLRATLPDPEASALSVRPGHPSGKLGRTLYRYWMAIKGDRPAPDRADFDPVAVKELLPYLFIAKRDAHSFRYALFGTWAAELYGKDLTGLTLEEAEFAQHLPTMRALYERVLREAGPMIANGTLDWRGKPYARVEILHLPLACRGPEPNKVLGLMVDHFPDTPGA